MSLLAQNFVLAAFGGRKKILAPPFGFLEAPPGTVTGERFGLYPPQLGVQILPPLVVQKTLPPRRNLADPPPMQLPTPRPPMALTLPPPPPPPAAVAADWGPSWWRPSCCPVGWRHWRRICCRRRCQSTPGRQRIWTGKRETKRLFYTKVHKIVGI